ncbi:hypothetical protein [Xenorhabdus bovienii]|uniref:hypothetical protein n=1 Tax=Xenorhabdus bovienii TaxID=40576 RepID=UPI0023B312FB|nr:hypothetical protein [Xenorhabdus bovienii]MDE9462226.1 hypothetical protein [Xenorhabdus bovienii]MDE9470182.1 hypothetical protein [Xenorhabdus bovienii]
MKLGSLYAVLSELQKSADLDEYQQALDSVLLQIPLNDEKIKNEKTHTQEKINFPLSTLLLPSAMNHYCPEFIPIERNIGIDIEKKLIQDIPLALSRTYITSFVNGKNLKYTCTMLSGMLGVFAGPIIGIILDLIFPPKSLDMEQIMKEVRKQIGGEIGNYDKEKLLNKFDNTSRKANLLAELIKQLEEAENKNDKETANKLRQQVSTRRSTHYDDCLDLANEVLVPPSNLEEYYIHYKLAPLYPLVMNAAISSISSYLIEFRVNKAIIDDYTSLLNKSYGFLQKLEEQALSLNNGAIRRDEYVNWVTWRKRYYVKDFINSRQLSVNNGGYSDKRDAMLYMGVAINERVSYFILESIGIRSYLQMHDNIAKKFNEITGKNIPQNTLYLYKIRLQMALSYHKALWEITKGIISPYYNLDKFVQSHPSISDYTCFIYDSKNNKLITTTAIGQCSNTLMLCNPSNYDEKGQIINPKGNIYLINIALPVEYSCELFRVVKLPNGNSKVEAKTILRGQTSHINLMYWNAWHIYIDTTNFHPDIKILGYFDMDKGKKNESVI